MRLKGAAFFDVEARDPWVAQAPAAAQIAPYVMPVVEHVIAYHGEDVLLGPLDGAPAVLSAGDILVFPQDEARVLSSAPGMRREPVHGNRILEAGGSLPD